MTNEVALLEADELWVGEGRAVRVGKHRLFVLRLEDRVACYEDRCPHLGFPLSEGHLEGKMLVCAAHGWEFDADSGLGLNPRSCRLRSVPVRLEGGKVVAQLEGEE